MPRLVIRSPNGAERYHELTPEPATVGRSPENAVHIDSAGASREHCRLEQIASGYRVTDLGSRNGTKVNGRPVDSHDLMPGDVIRVGDHSLTYDTRDAPVEKYSQATIMMDDDVSALEAVPSAIELSAAEPAPEKDPSVLRALMGIEDGESEEPGPVPGGASRKPLWIALGAVVLAGAAAAVLHVLGVI